MYLKWQIIIIIIVIVIVTYRLPAGSLQTTFLGYITLNLFCFYNYGTYNAISHDKNLLIYVSTFRGAGIVPSTAVFYSFLMSWFPGKYVFQIYSTWFLDDLSFPYYYYYYYYYFCLQIPHRFNLYCKVFIF
jgi:hypothetical protein